MSLWIFFLVRNKWDFCICVFTKLYDIFAQWKQKLFFKQMFCIVFLFMYFLYFIYIYIYFFENKKLELYEKLG